jgi:hypothetical protein
VTKTVQSQPSGPELPDMQYSSALSGYLEQIRSTTRQLLDLSFTLSIVILEVIEQSEPLVLGLPARGFTG